VSVECNSPAIEGGKGGVVVVLVHHVERAAPVRLSYTAIVSPVFIPARRNEDRAVMYNAVPKKSGIFELA